MDEPESPGLGLDLPEVPQKASASPYRVLARKYRPQNFDQLIGQDAMVQTLANAIERGHLLPYTPRESGGRGCRQPGQVRKEAATTISSRVVPAPTSEA